MIIWLVSYPRSGNTLTRSVFKHYFDLSSLSVYGDKNDIGSNPEFSQLVGHLDGDINTIELDALRASDEPTLIKTHDGPNPTMSPEDAFVHIVRDGRDSVLSYYHYARDISAQTDVTLSDVISGQIEFGLWGYHTARWFRADQFNVKRFRFEDIVQDKYGFASELSGLIGRSPNSEPFPDTTTFKSAAPNFVRSGKSGGWKDAFSESDLALFNQYNSTAMRLMGYYDGIATTEDVDAYLRFAQHLDSTRRNLSATRHDLTATRQELTQTIRDLKKTKKDRDRVRQNLDIATCEFSELKDRFKYLEKKEKKRIRRANRLRSIIGARPRRLPWERE